MWLWVNEIKVTYWATSLTSVHTSMIGSVHPKTISFQNKNWHDESPSSFLFCRDSVSWFIYSRSQWKFQLIQLDFFIYFTLFTMQQGEFREWLTLCLNSSSPDSAWHIEQSSLNSSAQSFGPNGWHAHDAYRSCLADDNASGQGISVDIVSQNPYRQLEYIVIQYTHQQLPRTLVFLYMETGAEGGYCEHLCTNL